MKKGGFWLLMVVGVVFLSGGMTFAADGKDGIENYTLGEIVVTDQHQEVTAASNVYAINAEKISNMGATTLADVLALVPGVNIRVGGQGTPRVDIRGFKTRHVILLLNGVPVNDTYDGQFDPTSFPAGVIAEVRVITGGGSVLYGPGGSGGVINIITKKGNDSIRGGLAGEYGTKDAWLARTHMAGDTGKFDYLLSASREYGKGFPLSDDFQPTEEEDGGTRGNSDSERDAALLNMGYVFSGAARMGLTFNWYQGENGVPPATDRDEEDPFNKKPKYIRIDDLEGLSSQLAFGIGMNSPFGLRGWLYRNQLDMVENRYDDATYTTQDSRRSYRNDAATEISGIGAQLSYMSGKWLAVTLGLTMEDHSWEASGFEMVSAGGGGGGNSASSVTKSLFESNEEVDIKSVELEFEFTPRDSFGFVVGAGQHYLSGRDLEGDSDTAFLLGGRYDFSKTTRLSASVAQKIRFPSLKQLYDVAYGNPDLGSEKTVQYEIGFSRELPSRSAFSISTYYSEVEDYIEKIDDAPYANVEKYLFKGVDMSLETRYSENWTLRVAYSYLDSEDRSPDTTRDELQYRPKHKYIFESTYADSSGLMIHGDVVHVADQYYYAENTSPMLKRKLNDYTLINAKISQYISDEGMTMYVRWENILDTDF